MEDNLEDRLAAVERALTDGDNDCSALAEEAATAQQVADLKADLEELTDRVAELEAATQALRGYVGNIRSVNSDVEQRAELALSKAEAARRAVDRDGTVDGHETHDREREPARENGSQSSTPATDPFGGSEESGPDRCDHCDRPFDDRPPRRSPTADQSVSATSGDDRLATLRERAADSGRSVGEVTAGPQTDGGVSNSPDGEKQGSPLDRVRDLL